MVASPERMNIEQKPKTVVVEDNSVLLAKEFFSKPKHNAGGQLFHVRHGGY
jgi:hypothetical protein